jgi:hypothetical protein
LPVVFLPEADSVSQAPITSFCNARHKQIFVWSTLPFELSSALVGGDLNADREVA